MNCTTAANQAYRLQKNLEFTPGAQTMRSDVGRFRRCCRVGLGPHPLCLAFHRGAHDRSAWTEEFIPLHLGHLLLSVSLPAGHSSAAPSLRKHTAWCGSVRPEPLRKEPVTAVSRKLCGEPILTPSPLSVFHHLTYFFQVVSGYM